ncbi:hypothetical protein LZ30DRAFT_194693 [Colletotrichum cereale]|nr:hypothetical protein LZ30DRAFT_194693 [Colletotrichum cereale]
MAPATSSLQSPFHMSERKTERGSCGLSREWRHSESTDSDVFFIFTSSSSRPPLSPPLYFTPVSFLVWTIFPCFSCSCIPNIPFPFPSRSRLIIQAQPRPLLVASQPIPPHPLPVPDPSSPSNSNSNSSSIKSQRQQHGARPSKQANKHSSKQLS